jgi:hypothetical protein
MIKVLPEVRGKKKERNESCEPYIQVKSQVKSYGAFLPGGTQLWKVSGSAVWNVLISTMDGWQVRLQHGI